jgi:hypothetical protein
VIISSCPFEEFVSTVKKCKAAMNGIVGMDAIKHVELLSESIALFLQIPQVLFVYLA